MWRAEKHQRMRPRSMEALLVKRLPEEIRDEILLRLPIKSLLKCTAVCHSWKCLIRSPAFIHTHRSRTTTQSNSPNGGDQLLLLHTRDDIDIQVQIHEGSRDEDDGFSLHWDRHGSPSLSEYSKLLNPFVAYGEIKTTTATIPQPRAEDNLDLKQRTGEVVGTCNGLVCLRARDCNTLIWNPCIRKFVILPPPSVMYTWNACITQLVSYAFCGGDSRTNDYKVLRTLSRVCFDSPQTQTTKCEAEIWSLATGLWKRLSAAVIPADFSPGLASSGEVYFNGALHWIQSPNIFRGENYFILWFDVLSESFGKIAMPTTALERKTTGLPDPFVIKGRCFNISRYGESLAFFENYQDMEINSPVHINVWVMKEYGVVETWTKLLTICLPLWHISPLGFRKSTGEIVVQLFDLRDGKSECHSVDPKTKQLSDFRIDGCRYHYRFMDYFAETLVLLDHPDAISY